MDKHGENASGVLLSGPVADSVLEALCEQVQAATEVLAERNALVAEVAEIRSFAQIAERQRVSREAAMPAEPTHADKAEEDAALEQEVRTLKAAVSQRDRRIRELLAAADEAALLRAEKVALEKQLDQQQQAMDMLIAEVESLRVKLLRASGIPSAPDEEA